MKSFIFYLIIFVFTLNFGWSQSYSWVSSNRVDKHLIVHTIKINKTETIQSVSDYDEASEPAFVHDLIDQLKKLKGVIRSSFDMATYTFTLLANDEMITSDVNAVMDQFNFKMDE